MSGTFNPLRIQPPPEAAGNALAGPPQPDWADAVSSTSDAVQQWLADQRAKNTAAGYIDPVSGNQTPAGMRQLAWQVAFGLGGTDLSAPELSVAPSTSLSSRMNSLYNAPWKTPRPFADDYKDGAASDATGRLTTDIDGRPLGASFIAGRRILGGDDEAIAPAQFNALSEAAIGTRPATVAPRQLRQGSSYDAGRFVKTANPETQDAQYNIYINRSLSPPQIVTAAGHELGHMVDDLAGQIPTDGLTDELSRVYNTMTGGNEWRGAKLNTPRSQGYSGNDAPRELMATAIHAYLTNPNYLKTVAPDTATAIRNAVNANPRLKNVIQFNTIAGLMAGTGAAAGSSGNGQGQSQ